MNRCIFWGWAVGSSLAVAGALAADVEIRVAADKPSHAVSPRLYGIFFEDINFGGDGGLNAELVKNGSFEFQQPLMGWSNAGDGDVDEIVEISTDGPPVAASPHFVRFRASENSEERRLTNEGFRGIGVRQGETYVFSARAAAEDAGESLQVAIVGPEGKTLASSELTGLTPEWSETSVTLTPSATESKASLVLSASGSGTADFDLVSLCPEKTWRNRPHGMREDLAQKLADLKPAFLRFPGGCIVEGSELDRRYQWKTTIGDLSERKLIINRWNYEFRPSTHAGLLSVVRRRLLRVFSIGRRHWRRAVADSQLRHGLPIQHGPAGAAR